MTPPTPLDGGDILDAVVTHLPTLDLPSASDVSSAWRVAVASSVRRSPRLKPFLLLHLYCPRRCRLTSSLAYDPHSRSWAPLPPPPPPPGHVPLLSPWPPHLPRPRVSRVDPVIVVVGSSLLVAGAGAYDFEDAPPSAVEVLDLNDPSAGWGPSDPLPRGFSRSASARWLSVATSDDRLLVLERATGLFSSFDPRAGKWSRESELKPDPTTRSSAIGYSDDRLVFIGLSGRDPVTVTAWEVCLDAGWSAVGFREMGRMPNEMVEGLTGSGFALTRISFGLVGKFGYIYNPGDFMGGAVFWEIEMGRWERVERPEALDDDPTARIVFGCARVNLKKLLS